MERFKKFFFLKIWLLIPLVIIATALLVYVFFNGLENSPIAYVSYVISAYALTAVVCRLPGLFKKIKNKLYSNPHSRRYLTEAELRARISLYSGLCIHLIYSVFKFASGIYYGSVWPDEMFIPGIIIRRYDCSGLSCIQKDGGCKAKKISA